jgi:hypothetical protein
VNWQHVYRVRIACQLPREQFNFSDSTRTFTDVRGEGEVHHAMTIMDVQLIMGVTIVTTVAMVDKLRNFYNNRIVYIL